MITVLTVAGFDPSAGAGVLADIRTIGAFGCFGVAVVTSITEQNTTDVFNTHHLDRELISGQLEAILSDFDIAAAKTGMLPTRASVEAVAERLASSRIQNVVIDPVLKSSSDYPLAGSDVLDALINSLLPLASVITPNASEASAMTGINVTGVESMQEAALAIIGFGAKAVLVKGGDLAGDAATDVLADGGECIVLDEPKVNSTNTHGTGCALSSAIACLLATGSSLEESVRRAKRYVAEAIRTAPGLGHGRGPLNNEARERSPF